MHNRVPYDSALILLPHREPIRSWHTIECRMILLWFCYHKESPAKLSHDWVPYDSALILLPHREPQRSWRTIDCRTILLWFCYHTESPSEADAWSSAVWFCSDSVNTQGAPSKLTHDQVPNNSALILLLHREPQQSRRSIECHTITTQKALAN